MSQLIQLIVAALTVLMEAGGEPYLGKLAVAYVVRNRARARGKSLTDTCLQPYQFSCWNTESPTRSNVDVAVDGSLADCLKAVLAAYWYLELDPTQGADHYLNVEATLAAAGRLPDWYDAAKVTIKIGRHDFLKLG